MLNGCGVGRQLCSLQVDELQQKVHMIIIDKTVRLITRHG